MYRHAPLVVACTGCSAPVPLKWAELDPRGSGHRCFRCVLATQVQAHDWRARCRADTRLGVRVAILTVAAVPFLLFLMVLLVVACCGGRFC